HRKKTRSLVKAKGQNRAVQGLRQTTHHITTGPASICFRALSRPRPGKSGAGQSRPASRARRSLMDLQRVTLSDIVDFHPRELSDDQWSRIESHEGVKALRRPLEESHVPGGWAGVRNKIVAEFAGNLLDIRILDVMRGAWKKGRELETYR